MRINTSAFDASLLDSSWMQGDLRCTFLPKYNLRFNKGYDWLGDPNFNPLTVWTLSAVNATAGITAYTVSGWHEEVEWAPVPIIGPHRICYVGSVLHFAAESYTRWGKTVTDAGGSHQWWFERGEDEGDDESLPAADSTSSTPTHLYSTAGLYRVIYKCTCEYPEGSGRSYTSWAYRWVRVLSLTEADNFAICPAVKVNDLAGSLEQGGWSAELDISYSMASSAIDDYAGVMIYSRDSFGTTSTVTETRVDPNQVQDDAGLTTLFFGYIVAGSIRQNPQTASVSFQARTPEYFLQDQMMLNHDYWDIPTKGSGYCLTKLTVPDVVRHLLVDKNRTTHQSTNSNFSDWHDVWIYQVDAATYPNQQNVVYRLTVNEGMMWAGIQDICNNDYLKPYCDRLGRLHISPDLTCRWRTWWTSVGTTKWGLRPLMTFDDDLLTSIDVDQTPPDKVALVKLNATTSKDKQLEAQSDSVFDMGAWEIVNGLLTDNKTYLKSLAEAMLRRDNARFTVRCSTLMNHVVDIGDLVLVVHSTDPDDLLLRDDGTWILGHPTRSILGETTRLT